MMDSTAGQRLSSAEGPQAPLQIKDLWMLDGSWWLSSCFLWSQQPWQLGMVWWSSLQSMFKSLLSYTSLATLSKFLNSSEPASSSGKQEYPWPYRVTGESESHKSCKGNPQQSVAHRCPGHRFPSPASGGRLAHRFLKKNPGERLQTRMLRTTFQSPVRHRVEGHMTQPRAAFPHTQVIQSYYSLREADRSAHLIQHTWEGFRFKRSSEVMLTPHYLVLTCPIPRSLPENWH